MSLLPLTQRLAHPRRIQGPIIEAPLVNVAIGELCLIRASIRAREPVGRAQVIGFRDEVAVLSMLGTTTGLSREAVVVPTGARLTVELSTGLLGTVLDATGQCAAVLRDDEPAALGVRRMEIDASPPDFLQRRPIDRCMPTGIRAIDGLLTCGIGQRLGIFASAGCGKTSLMNMLIDHAGADVYVVALVGERGREVSEFVERVRTSTRRDRTIVVYATSDRSSVDRCNAAMLATTVAEYFRDRGQNVMLFLDSMTRYARALRDVALSAGEPPARRGYPASVFETMPRLLERAGRTASGSLTAFYTVLLENEDEPDPIGDEVRSILDGHIYLSRKLAGQGQFPAIDVLQSASRLFDEVATSDHQAWARQFRGHLARLDEMQILVDLGEYRPGENPDNDRAMAKRGALDHFLRQPLNECAEWADTLERMREAV
ncbi:type III secretion system ATPase SctN [Burkholderia ubonensis]|uniref:type III secretion system ATPase SctN n=1 Tax=Burkholderia ubonensis TaxID=101571 RepID=UPI00075A3E4C|nr:type III secretion system ATPase SctN [Burkholderia ubonensis]KVC71755.1 ATP synthase [Burkholderia ubonensis]